MRASITVLYYPLGAIGTVPRAYDGMEWEKNKNLETLI
jgi:hypothetical protein